MTDESRITTCMQEEELNYRELAEELDSLDMMLSSLVEVLERKGILTEDEWEKQIKVNIKKSAGKTKYRDIQFTK